MKYDYLVSIGGKLVKAELDKDGNWVSAVFYVPSFDDGNGNSDFLKFWEDVVEFEMLWGGYRFYFPTVTITVIVDKKLFKKYNRL